MKFTEDRLEEIFAPMGQKFVAIVGDIMLDRYIWGEVTRISPEAPVPVVDVKRESMHMGGASNVALNIRSLGANPVLFGAVGSDANADDLRRLCSDNKIMTDFLVVDEERPTTVKTRIIAGSQHVVRIDYEERKSISAAAAAKLTDKLERHIHSLHAIVLQDYNKGVLGEDIIRRIIGLAAERHIPILVDPKYHHFFSYQGVTVFKPNRKESEDALGLRMRDEDDFQRAARLLHERISCDNILLTLGEHGMLLQQKDGSTVRIPTRARKVADVSGAGDTVIATLAATVACGATVIEAAHLANFAGGLVCEEVGIVPVNRDALLDAAAGRLGELD
jgi:D-glycero-beta-D-manno-heptose-7-phosphate kinase